MDKLGPNIGLLGGTFDPPHIAHLRIAEETREAFQLEEIWFIPAGYPPHKGIAEATYEARLEMLKLSLKGNPKFKCLEIERDERPSYTLKSLEKLKNIYPHYKFYLLVGWDAFAEIETWWHYEKFLDYTKLIVLSRGKGDWSIAENLVKEKALSLWGEKALGRVHFLQVSSLEISSTKIRELIKKGKSIRYLVPEEVFFYLQNSSLY
ncbi:MAG: nicotinate (nicotinamide) nucleotide adenylyltransferase, partial [Caldimicrobium sp.]